MCNTAQMPSGQAFALLAHRGPFRQTVDTLEWVRGRVSFSLRVRVRVMGFYLLGGGGYGAVDGGDAGGDGGALVADGGYDCLGALGHERRLRRIAENGISKCQTSEVHSVTKNTLVLEE